MVINLKISESLRDNFKNTATVLDNETNTRKREHGNTEIVDIITKQNKEDDETFDKYDNDIRRRGIDRPQPPKSGIFNMGKDIINSFISRKENHIYFKKNPSYFTKKVQTLSYNENVCIFHIMNKFNLLLKEILSKYNMDTIMY